MRLTKNIIIIVLSLLLTCICVIRSVLYIDDFIEMYGSAQQQLATMEQIPQNVEYVNKYFVFPAVKYLLIGLQQIVIALCVMLFDVCYFKRYISTFKSNCNQYKKQRQAKKKAKLEKQLENLKKDT